MLYSIAHCNQIECSKVDRKTAALLEFTTKADIYEKIMSRIMIVLPYSLSILIDIDHGMVCVV